MGKALRHMGRLEEAELPCKVLAVGWRSETLNCTLAFTFLAGRVGKAPLVFQMRHDRHLKCTSCCFSMSMSTGSPCSPSFTFILCFSAAGWVTEGEGAFSDMSGSPPKNVHQEALRGIAKVLHTLLTC